MTREIEAEVRKIFRENSEAGEKIDNMSLEDKLGEIGLNSLIYIRILASIEEKFDIEFDDEDLDINKFQDLQSIITYIKEKLSNK